MMFVEADQRFVIGLMYCVQIGISDQIQRRTTRSMIQHMDMMSQPGLLTVELLNAMNISETAKILTAAAALRHCPQIHGRLRNAHHAATRYHTRSRRRKIMLALRYTLQT
jgi:hypothetical protein